MPNWDHGVEQWLLRLRLLCQHRPKLQLPPITEDDRQHIIGQELRHGAVSYKEIKEREVKPVVMAWLSEAQRGVAGQARTGASDAGERPSAEGGLRSNRFAAYFVAHPGVH